ncbi:hypothetical protein KI387_023406, partial [Taxus chinensis]
SSNDDIEEEIGVNVLSKFDVDTSSERGTDLNSEDGIIGRSGVDVGEVVKSSEMILVDNEMSITVNVVGFEPMSTVAI